MRYLSVFQTDEEILKALSEIHLKGNWYDLDCTYSKGVFYKNIEQPNIKSDLFPINEDIIKSDSQNLYFIENNKINSIIFDPPFLFRNRPSKYTDKIGLRFSYFKSFNEVAYILEGKIEIVSDDKTITVRGGDCYLMKIGDRVRYNIKSYTKAFWFTFPVDSSAMDEIDKLINTAKNSGKMIS